MQLYEKYLNDLTCDVIASFCKQKKITYYRGKTRLRKAEMIKLLLDDERSKRGAQRNVTQVSEEPEQTAEKPKQEDKEKEDEKVPFKCPKIVNYLLTLSPGIKLVFRRYNGTLDMAAVEEVDRNKREIDLVTQYGRKYHIKFDDVYWVCTKDRIPRKLLIALKKKMRVPK